MPHAHDPEAYQDKVANGICVRNGCYDDALRDKKGKIIDRRCARHIELDQEQKAARRAKAKAEGGHCSDCLRPFQTELKKNGNPYTTCSDCRERRKALRLAGK